MSLNLSPQQIKSLMGFITSGYDQIICCKDQGISIVSDNEGNDMFEIRQGFPNFSHSTLTFFSMTKLVVTNKVD